MSVGILSHDETEERYEVQGPPLRPSDLLQSSAPGAGMRSWASDPDVEMQNILCLYVFLGRCLLPFYQVLKSSRKCGALLCKLSSAGGCPPGPVRLQRCPGRKALLPVTTRHSLDPRCLLPATPGPAGVSTCRGAAYSPSPRVHTCPGGSHI